MASRRIEKIDELIKHELAETLPNFVDPEIFYSVTQVDVSPDLSHAKIWISALSDSEEVVKKIQHSAKEIRSEIAHSAKLRKIPYLHFYPDNTSREAAKIDKIINSIEQK